jgi:pyruvate formate lyase activating enzyme
VCEKIKQLGYPVKLDTNGSRPQVVKKLIHEGLVDYIAMDIKTDPFHYSPWIKKDCNPHSILASIQVIMNSTLSYEFRTTCVKPIINADAIANIAKFIRGAMLYALQRFYKTTVLHPEFFRDRHVVFDEDELNALKSLAEPWVKTCIVR